jgi:putative addiction module killer protein
LTICIRSDTILSVVRFYRTEPFDAWLRGLRDRIAKARILARLRAAELGNWGDCQAVDDGVSEMRVHVGPGYRIYFARRGASVYWLLYGGDKSSQKRDIGAAKALLKSLEDRQ